MPKPVRIALESAVTSDKVSKTAKKIIKEVLKEADSVSFRFASLPDDARQAIRLAVIADLKANTYVSITACAVAYGCTAPNVKKWRDEDKMGIKKIRARGRKEGTKNQLTHLPDGSTIPFVPVAERRNNETQAPAIKSIRKVVKGNSKPVKASKSVKVVKVAKVVKSATKKPEKRVHRLVIKEVKGTGNARHIKAVPVAKRGRPKGSKNKAKK